MKVFLTRPGKKRKASLQDNDCNRAGSSFDAVQLQDDAVKPNMVFLLLTKTIMNAMRIIGKSYQGVPMKRKAIALITSFVLLGTTPAFGATGEDYSSKVSVLMDNQSIYDANVPNFLINGRTVVPLKAFADSLGAFIQQMDGGTIELVKPNVNLIVSESAKVSSAGDRFSVEPFSAVSVGQKIAPHIYYVVDNAPLSDSLSYKIIVFDPSNREIYSSSVNTMDTEEKGTGFVGILTLDEITFDKAGSYKVQFQMKNKSDSYLKVGQTIIKAND
jgi:hypothetical protein